MIYNVTFYVLLIDVEYVHIKCSNLCLFNMCEISYIP